MLRELFAADIAGLNCDIHLVRVLAFPRVVCDVQLSGANGVLTVNEDFVNEPST